MKRDRATGRAGRETEPFAIIPQDAMQSPALADAPHAAFRVLAILLMGKAKERNGLLACTDSYARTYGINSRDTVYRSLQTLRERGLIIVTRPGMKMRKLPTLYAVTWWPNHYRDGKPLDRPEEPTRAYAKWKSVTSIDQAEIESHTDCRESVTPASGANGCFIHTDLTNHARKLHTDSREYSKNLGMGSA